MRKAEFLQELKAALQGEISPEQVRDNLEYYDQYISQEMASGRSEEEVIEEIGGPRLIAKTIIDSSDAAGDGPSGGFGGGSYDGYEQARSSGNGRGNRGGMQVHYVDLNKWYWKVIVIVVVAVLVMTVFMVLGGILHVLMRVAGPLLLVWLIYTLIRKLWR